MVKFLAGQKGEGKTSKIIGLANDSVDITDGVVVFIDDDKRHIHDLHRQIRFVEAEYGLFENYREFVGYLLGILSQNSDIAHIYVDGFNTVPAELPAFLARLEELSEKEHVNFTLSLHENATDLPPEIVKLLI